MVEIAFSSSFKRAKKKRVDASKEKEEKFWQKVEIFTINPFDERLRTHKLSGKLQELYSFSVEYDLRVIFYFVNDTKAVFIDVGTHDEVY